MKMGMKFLKQMHPLRRATPENTHFCNVGSEADPASKLGGTISAIFGSQVSLQVHYCKRHKVYFATLL